MIKSVVIITMRTVQLIAERIPDLSAVIDRHAVSLVVQLAEAVRHNAGVRWRVIMLVYCLVGGRLARHLESVDAVVFVVVVGEIIVVTEGVAGLPGWGCAVALCRVEDIAAGIFAA